uniref:Uncharacterized protein n=1 Tax=Oryza sativa subsp. japonica TaxID=39947 RepID=Q33AB4_ORYSJ|nr:hypothetical protein LOC_Os10g12730 [Oryza sativa Japonica Group]
MALRKPNPVQAVGPDPGRVDDDNTSFLGVSLMDDDELAKLVSSRALVEGQAFAPGKAVVPKPVDNRTVVFAVFFEAGLRFPCNVLLQEILRLFQVTVDPSEEVDGLPKLVLLEGMNMLTLDQAEAEARKMIGDVSVVEYSQLLTWQAAGRANRVFNGELPPRANSHKTDDEAGPSRKRTRGEDSDADDEEDAEGHDDEEEGGEEEEVEIMVEKATGEAVKGRAEAPGYTLTPSPGHNETGVESNSSLLRQKDLDGAKALVAFSSGEVAKGGPIKKVAKKKGLVDVARVFSDDESSDGTPTSPAGRNLDLSATPVPPLGAAGAGGSTAAGASASAERIVTAAAKVYGSPPRQPVASPLIEAKGKRVVVETSASEYSLTVPRFAPGDFETRADLLPFVEGVSNLVLLASAPSLFTELNEFDEGCSAIKSLAVRILAAHCSTERTVRARLDGFKSRLRAKDDEIGCKNLEMEALANALKKAKAENKRLQSELEKGKEARAEVDRLKAELEKEKAHSAVLTDYYNLTEPKMEALRQEVLKAEASTAEESRHFSWEMAGGSISDCATAYDDCCARVSAAFTMGLLQQFGCEHITEFPNYAKWDWEISAQDISPALRAWRRQFWQKDGRSTAKTRLLEQLAKAEAADLCEEEDAAAEGGGGDAQDHPEV